MYIASKAVSVVWRSWRVIYFKKYVITSNLDLQAQRSSNPASFPDSKKLGAHGLIALAVIFRSKTCYRTLMLTPVVRLFLSVLFGAADELLNPITEPPQQVISPSETSEHWISLEPEFDTKNGLLFF